MHRILTALFLFLLPASLSSEEAKSPIISEVTRISIQHYHLFETAVAEAEKHNLSISGYDLVLLTEGTGFVVFFSDPDRPEGLLGSSPNMSEFVVILEANGEVVQAHFVR